MWDPKFGVEKGDGLETTMTPNLGFGVMVGDGLRLSNTNSFTILAKSSIKQKLGQFCIVNPTNISPIIKRSLRVVFPLPILPTRYHFSSLHQQSYTQLQTPKSQVHHK